MINLLKCGVIHLKMDNVQSNIIMNKLIKINSNYNQIFKLSTNKMDNEQSNSIIDHLAIINSNYNQLYEIMTNKILQMKDYLSNIGVFECTTCGNFINTESDGETYINCNTTCKMFCSECVQKHHENCSSCRNCDIGHEKCSNCEYCDLGIVITEDYKSGFKCDKLNIYVCNKCKSEHHKVCSNCIQEHCGNSSYGNCEYCDLGIVITEDYKSGFKCDKLNIYVCKKCKSNHHEKCPNCDK
jgi:hypothetical protein